MSTFSDDCNDSDPDVDILSPTSWRSESHVDTLATLEELGEHESSRRAFLKRLLKAGAIAGGAAGSAKISLQVAEAWSFNPSSYVTPIAYRCYPVSQWYGPTSYSHRSGESAAAIDIGCPSGTPVYAPKDGVIAFEGWETLGGIVCRINHADGLQSILAHLSSTVVDAGWRVRGSYTLIGYSGRTGQGVTGPHLHWGLKIQGTQSAIRLDGVPGVSRTRICP